MKILKKALLISMSSTILFSSFSYATFFNNKDRNSSITEMATGVVEDGNEFFCLKYKTDNGSTKNACAVKGVGSASRGYNSLFDIASKAYTNKTKLSIYLKYNIFRSKPMAREFATQGQNTNEIIALATCTSNICYKE